jgi:hypothetical protein
MKHRGQRRPTNATVRFFTRPATMGIGFVTNISATGAFMETHTQLSVLSVLYLEPTDPSLADGHRGRIAATVVRRSAMGVGLEWCEFAAETTKVYACLADGSNDLAAYQLPLPAMPDAPPSHPSFNGP